MWVGRTAIASSVVVAVWWQQRQRQCWQGWDGREAKVRRGEARTGFSRRIVACNRLGQGRRSQRERAECEHRSPACAGHHGGVGRLIRGIEYNEKEKTTGTMAGRLSYVTADAACQARARLPPGLPDSSAFGSPGLLGLLSSSQATGLSRERCCPWHVCLLWLALPCMAMVCCSTVL